MIRLIPDLYLSTFSLPALSVSAPAARFALICALALCASPIETLAAQSQSSDNSSAKPSPTANPAPAKPADDKLTQKPVHQKKVFTDDDFIKSSKPASANDLDTEENNPVCGLTCEDVLRKQWGYGPEREAEFRNQLTLARHEISYDRIWNNHLEAALKALGDWCDIQRQKAQILGKGTPWSNARDNVNSRFAEREQKLVLQHRNESGYLTQHIEAIQRFAPFRAALMQYEVSETTNRVCSEYNMP